MKSSSILGNILKKSTLDSDDKLPIPRSKSETNLNRFYKHKEKIKSKFNLKNLNNKINTNVTKRF